MRLSFNEWINIKKRLLRPKWCPPSTASDSVGLKDDPSNDQCSRVSVYYYKYLFNLYKIREYRGMLRTIAYLIYGMCCISCTQMIIDPEQTDTPVVKITGSASHVSVDYATIELTVNKYNFTSIQVRRDKNEAPQTVYDGTLVMHHNTLDASFTDESFTDESLIVNQAYYYSIFSYNKNGWAYDSSFQLKTITKKEALRNVINDYIDAAHQTFSIGLSSSDFNFLMENDAPIDHAIMGEIDALFPTQGSLNTNLVQYAVDNIQSSVNVSITVENQSFWSKETRESIINTIQGLEPNDGDILVFNLPSLN